jgi:putative membrane protein
MRFGGFGGPGPGSGVGFVFLPLLLLLFAAILWLAVTSTHRREMHGHGRWSHSPDHHERRSGGDSEARKILDRRFASGEIDDEEYQRRRKLLDGES